MQRRSFRYHAYLIRLWEEGAPGAWRASAQSVQSGITVRFGDIESLLAFLQTELKETPGRDEAGDGKRIASVRHGTHAFRS
ncbi:MAG: hypothetical protein DYG89_27985 [Caldilinea sp. CFX5]|nr:hypothetical protein [Caldilinea sp. CFX5]